MNYHNKLHNLGFKEVRPALVLMGFLGSGRNTKIFLTPIDVVKAHLKKDPNVVHDMYEKIDQDTKLKTYKLQVSHLNYLFITLNKENTFTSYLRINDGIKILCISTILTPYFWDQILVKLPLPIQRQVKLIQLL